MVATALRSMPLCDMPIKQVCSLWAAAGNESAALPSYPAMFSNRLSNVLSVGAHSSSSTLAGFSNRVGGSSAVQVDAPGVSIMNTYAGNNRYARLSGTSMAAPHVAGLATLALSANSQLAPSQLRQLIIDGADRSIRNSDSQGGINAALTVAMAASYGGSGSSLAAASSGNLGSGRVTIYATTSLPVATPALCGRYP